MSVKKFNRTFPIAIIAMIAFGLISYGTEGALRMLSLGLVVACGGYLICWLVANGTILSLQAEVDVFKAQLGRKAMEVTKWFNLFDEIATYVINILQSGIPENEVINALIGLVNSRNLQIQLLETANKQLREALAAATAELDEYRQFANEQATS